MRNRSSEITLHSSFFQSTRRAVTFRILALVALKGLYA